MTREILQKDVDYLTKNPDEISDYWLQGTSLFGFVSLSNDLSTVPIKCGCLTMISKGNSRAINSNGSVNEELTLRIRGDERLPSTVNDIKVEHLPVFMEWQLEIQKLRDEQNS